MSDASDKEAAFEELVRLVQPNAVPTLSAADIEEILDRNQRAQRWAAATGLSLGKVIQPNARTGRVFRVIKEGTTGTAEPAWPNGDDDTLVDGTVMLIEAGVDFENVYNIRAAAEECWALKERKGVELSIADASFAKECREQRKSLASVLIA